MRKSDLWLALIIALALGSCEENTTETEVDDTIATNMPITTNVLNSFTYTLIADTFTGTSPNALQFTTDTLNIVVTSFNYQGGQAIVTVRDAANVILFADTVLSSTTRVIADMKLGIPHQCTVAVTGLTGTLIVELAGKQ